MCANVALLRFLGVFDKYLGEGHTWGAPRAALCLNKNVLMRCIRQNQSLCEIHGF